MDRSNHFIENRAMAIENLSSFLICIRAGHCNGISFIDSTLLAVCHLARIHLAFKKSEAKPFCHIKGHIERTRVLSQFFTLNLLGVL